MLVEFQEVSVAGREIGPVAINPRHVIQAQRAVNQNDPDAQAFTTQLTVEEIGKVVVSGTLTEVKQKLGGVR